MEGILWTWAMVGTWLAELVCRLNVKCCLFFNS